MRTFFKRPRAWVVVLGLSLIAGCGVRAGGSGSTSSTSSGSSAIIGRKCGMGAPCSAGAKCEVGFGETDFTCACDASNHYFCEHSDYGGGRPTLSCTVETACGAQGGAGGAGTGGAASCSESNGYCTRTCECMGACSDKCDGMGPPKGVTGYVCDEGACAIDPVYSCSVNDKRVCLRRAVRGPAQAGHGDRQLPIAGAVAVKSVSGWPHGAAHPESSCWSAYSPSGAAGGSAGVAAGGAAGAAAFAAAARGGLRTSSASKGACSSTSLSRSGPFGVFSMNQARSP